VKNFLAPAAFLVLCAVTACASREILRPLASSTSSVPPTTRRSATPVLSATFTPSFMATQTPTPLPTSTTTPTATPSFDEVVARLDSPQILSEFMKSYFTFKFHIDCVSYGPERFYQVRSGDCKDYATFASYVLNQHGYTAEIVVFTWYRGDENDGHDVVAFEDERGAHLQYMSNGDLMGGVDSIQDMLQKERLRLTADRIGSYSRFPAGTINLCTR